MRGRAPADADRLRILVRLAGRYAAFLAKAGTSADSGRERPAAASAGGHA